MGFSIGLSGSRENAHANDRQVGLGEAPYTDYAPRLDLAYRLADMANQYGAQENLLFGGAGYGGSFESADQKAARAKGEYLNPKPYGGWGGYGSENPVLQSGPATPAPTPTQGTDVVPGGTSGGGGTPSGWTGGWAGGGTGATPAPSTGGMQVPGGGVGVPVNYGPGGVEMPTTSVSIGGNSGYSPKSDPGVLATKALLAKAGAPSQVTSAATLQINKGLAAGLTPEQIAQHYVGKSREYGGDWAKMNLAGHGANWKLDDGVIAGLKSGQNMSQTGWLDPRWGQGVEGAQPIGTPVPAPGGDKKGTRVPVSAYSAFETPAMSSSAPVPEMASSTNTVDPSKGFWDTLQGGAKQITESEAFKNWLSQQNWNNSGAAAANATTTGATGTTGAGLEPAAMSVDGGNGGLVWDPFNGEWKPGGGDLGGGGYAVSGGGNGSGLSKGPRIGDLEELPPGASSTIQYPVWGRQWVWQEPELDENGKMIPIKGADGKIAYKMKTVSRDKWEFEQGQNDGQTADAWSTSAPWRPEEPTGGLYGGYSDLAAGKLTDYENEIGKNWRDMYSNPNLPSDDAYSKLLGEYQKSPGKGIDEAYGAYNKMLQGNGYSDAERGAIEGSAVRGVTQGYQRNADELRRQGARTGNANAAYAAMAQGGASYGSQLGEINRQNQLKFADEAQRRQEVGGQGMTNVASLANTKAQFGLNAGADYAKEMARRKEAAARGMGDYAAFGRGLQQQGLTGLNDLLKQQNQSKQNTYQQIASLLNQGSGSASRGNAKDFGWNAGVAV